MLKKQIVFSDYDGTIYVTEDCMDKNITAIKEYCNLCGKFVIVTGRSKLSVNKIIEKYHIPYDYIIANNGAIIIDSNGDILYKQSIEKIVQQIIEYLKSKKDIQILVYDENGETEFSNQELFKMRVKFKNYDLAKSMEKELNELFGINIIAHAAFPKMHYKDIDYAFIDIVSKKAGKETSIKKLLDILKIDKEQAITIGDGRNDINMIREYNGYSLITAEDEAKEVASKIFDGVATALKELMY